MAEQKSTGYTVAEQIDGQKTQIKYMERTLPGALRAGTLTPDRAEDRLGCARAILETLEKLRAIVRGEE